MSHLQNYWGNHKNMKGSLQLRWGDSKLSPPQDHRSTGRMMLCHCFRTPQEKKRKKKNTKHSNNKTTYNVLRWRDMSRSDDQYVAELGFNSELMQNLHFVLHETSSYDVRAFGVLFRFLKTNLSIAPSPPLTLTEMKHKETELSATPPAQRPRTPAFLCIAPTQIQRTVVAERSSQGFQMMRSMTHKHHFS